MIIIHIKTNNNNNNNINLKKIFLKIIKICKKSIYKIMKKVKIKMKIKLIKYYLIG